MSKLPKLTTREWDRVKKIAKKYKSMKDGFINEYDYWDFIETTARVEKLFIKERKN